MEENYELRISHGEAPGGLHGSAESDINTRAFGVHAAVESGVERMKVRADAPGAVVDQVVGLEAQGAWLQLRHPVGHLRRGERLSVQREQDVPPSQSRRGGWGVVRDFKHEGKVIPFQAGIVGPVGAERLETDAEKTAFLCGARVPGSGKEQHQGEEREFLIDMEHESMACCGRRHGSRLVNPSGGWF